MDLRTDVVDVFRERLEAHGEALSAVCRRVADYIDANRAAVLATSAAELATRTGTSDATVIRTVQILGFAGLGELRQALLASVERPSDAVENMRRTLGDVGESTATAVDLVLDAHDEAMREIRLPGARRRIVEAVSALNAAERIAVFGIGPSAALASYAATLLTRGGRRTLTLNATGSMLADQMLDLRSGDAMLVMAYGRAYGEVVAVFGEARRLNLPIVLVTDSLDEKLGRHASVVLPARRGRANQVALHGATLVCLEALVLGLAAASPRTVPTLERLNRLRTTVRSRTKTGG